MKKLVRRRLQYTLASSSAFYTLRDHACMSSPISAVRDDNGWLGLIRTITSRDLANARASSSSSSPSSPSSTSSANSASSASASTSSKKKSTSSSSCPGGAMFVLFHGGSQCEHSRAIWPIWLSVSRRLRGNCIVAINGQEDSMMNYNMMVLGFPTIMKVHSDNNIETYRGNRSVNEIISWIVNTPGGIAPLGNDYEIYNEKVLSLDGEWLGDKGNIYEWNRRAEIEILNKNSQRHHRSISKDRSVIDLTSEMINLEKGTNWSLWAANFVVFVQLIKFCTKASIYYKRYKRHLAHQQQRSHTD